MSAVEQPNTRMPNLVAGVDGCKGGWVAVVLADGRFYEARLIDGVESNFDELADLTRIAIDIPIEFGPRQADALARKILGGSSVFPIPARELFDAPFARGRISRQTWSLGARIRYVTAPAIRDPRFREVHRCDPVQ